MKWYFILLSAIGLLAGCSSDKDKHDTPPHPPENISPIPTLSVQLNNQPYNGLLEAYACKSGTGVYYGNYVGDKLSVFPATYVIANGEVGSYQNQIRLPKDNYNIMFWGVSGDEQYDQPQVIFPQLSIGADFEQANLALRKIFADTTYNPVYDYCFERQSVDVGSQNISLNLKRVVAGVKITVKHADATAFSSSIRAIDVRVGNIAQYMNFFTAQASNYTCTIKYHLNIASDRLSATTPKVMLFPSNVAPKVSVTVYNVSGSYNTYHSTLPEVLSPGTIVTQTIEIPN